MYTYKEITNELLDSLVNDIENTCEEVIFDIGEHKESNDAFLNEVAEARDEILFALVHKIKLKYLNKYTQD
tara:strand:+ start:277 stop:489 length:213 start_codon:yes stop_codon:yes gene_type:complete